MKKLCVLLIGTLVIAACFGLGAKPASAAEKHYVFGYSSPTMNNPFFQWIEQNARKEIESRGDKLITVDPQNDTQKQVSQIEDLVSQNIDLLLLCPFDSAGIKPALVAASDKKIPIVIYDTPVLDPEYVVTTVASDNINAGFVVGQDMMKTLAKDSDVAVIHSPVAETCRQRVDGFFKAIGADGDGKGGYFKVVANQDGKGDTGISMLLAEDILQGNPNLAGFFCINDPTAAGAVQAIKGASKTGKVLVWGVDGAPEAKAAIKEGLMIGTGAQSPLNIGKIAVEAAYKHLAGEKLEKDTVVETFIINKENIDQFDINGWQ